MHLTSAFSPSHTTVLDFQVPSGQKIAQVTTEIDRIVMAKMGLSHLLNIQEGGVGDVDKFPVY